jgi:hypothetical protein
MTGYEDDVAEGDEIVGLGSANRIWRVGETIRRSRWPWSDTSAALLRHLEDKSFAYSPRYLGIDGLGRDVLSLLPGEPTATLRGDAQLGQVARLLREIHDAVRQAARIADNALAGELVAVHLWRDGHFTENIARSLTWLAEHRPNLERALA